MNVCFCENVQGIMKDIIKCYNILERENVIEKLKVENCKEKIKKRKKHETSKRKD